MAKIDFAQQVIDLHGDNMQKTDSKALREMRKAKKGEKIEDWQVPTKDASLGELVADALNASYQGETLSPKDVNERYQLARKAVSAKQPQTLSAEQIATVKGIVVKAYAPGVAGPVLLMLDPPAEEEDEKPKGEKVAVPAEGGAPPAS